MNKPLPMILPLTLCVAVAVCVLSCGRRPAPLITFVPAPPGPTDLGPATGLSTAPADAIVFDLKYRPQTGGVDDIQYHAYWGYGGSMEETKTNSFLEEVRRRTTNGVRYLQNPSFIGREWAAVEYSGGQATALYFDVDADGRLGEKERILPTRSTGQGVQFITPDFANPLKAGGPILCRTLVEVNFYGGNSEPNCLWSPAALLEGTNTLNGDIVRLLIYESAPGGRYDEYGSSSYSLISGEQPRIDLQQYIPRETLSSVIVSDGKYYHLTVEGLRSNGLPARVLLRKDTSPTGELAVKLAGSNSLQASLSALYLHGLDEKTAYFRVGATKQNVVLPVGSYALNSGVISYQSDESRDWEVSFSKGPCATVRTGEVAQVALGQPTLRVRAVEESNRYNNDAVESTSFKKGTRIYLEPKILGKGNEVFGRFRAQKRDRPPRVTITSADGKQLLSKAMEYG